MIELKQPESMISLKQEFDNNYMNFLEHVFVILAIQIATIEVMFIKGMI